MAHFCQQCLASWLSGLKAYTVFWNGFWAVAASWENHGWESPGSNTSQSIFPLQNVCFFSFCYILFNDLCTYLEGGLGQRLRKWLQWVGLDQTKTRSQELHLDLPLGDGNPSIWVTFHCPPSCIGCELDETQSSKGLNQSSYGILVSQVEA